MVRVHQLSVCEWFDLCVTYLCEVLMPKAVKSAGGKAVIAALLAGDDTVAVDTAKLTADQATDAQAHADMVTLLTASGGIVAGLTDDGLSVMVFTLNADNATFSAKTILLAT